MMSFINKLKIKFLSGILTFDEILVLHWNVEKLLIRNRGWYYLVDINVYIPYRFKQKAENSKEENEINYFFQQK